MKSQKDYWDKKISEWSISSYKKTGKISLVERIATYFRAVDLRKEAALKLIGPKTKDKVIIDFGCGLGEFPFGLLMRYKPKKVIVYDISEVAIKEVKKSAKTLNLLSKLEFYVQDVSTMNKLPNSDMVIGLGFIDYLNPEQMRHLFELIGDRPYLFSYFEKKISFFNLLHKFYVTLQGCPGAFKYTRKQIRSFTPKNSKLYFIKKSGLQFITNYKYFR